MGNLTSLVSSLFGVTTNVFPPKFRGEPVSIGKEAYGWNHSVKSTFKALDFLPVLFTSADLFDPASMTPYLNHKAEDPQLSVVVAATLALMSTSSVSAGEEMTAERVWQTKTEVVTEKFFE